MNGTAHTHLEAIQPVFDASSSKAVWGSADFRLRIFDMTSGQIAADITEDVQNGSIADKNISKLVFSCLIWGQGKVRTGRGLETRMFLHAFDPQDTLGWTGELEEGAGRREGGREGGREG